MAYTRVNWQNHMVTKLGATLLNQMDEGIEDAASDADSAVVAAAAAQSTADAAIGEATVTAKGDLIAASASGTVDNLPVGTDGHVLTAASGETLGMEWGTVTGNATVATTVAGLGTGTDGKLGLLRLSSTPFAFVPLTYDGTYDKWVSPQWTLGSVGFFSETSTSAAERGGFSLPDYKAHTDAGLTLMLRLFSIGNRPGGAATSTTVFVTVDEWDGSDASITGINGSLISHEHSSAANTYVLSAWTAAGTPASLAHGMVRVASLISTAGTGTVIGAHVAARWEAASA